MKKNESLILLATYNGEKYLKECIDSFSENADIYVSDDCSSDNTISILKEVTGKNITISEGTSFGSAAKNFTFLINKCSRAYSYYFLADQDDVWTENKYDLLYKEMKYLEQIYGKNTPILIYGDSVVVDKGLKVIDNSFFDYDGIDPSIIKRNKLNLFFQNVGQGATMMFNLALLIQIRKIPENIYMHDWWLMLFAQEFGIVHFSKYKTLLYRQHGSNSIGAKKRFFLRQLLSQFKRKKKVSENLYNIRRQIEEFDNLYMNKVIDENTANFLNEFRNLFCGTILRRKLFLLRNKIFLSSLKRTLVLYIFF